ncbi:hypothetical protein IVB45_37075 (plasmid) [Bradyrhizobium sp. 4]|uniref:hypothetical protein n=1 Tax=unclassified Bradyrhizobium TaxID=2631580 RepID=UPI001FF7F453|nr:MULTISPECIES: hypothetical protein [unclassified Bradyrhizobium]MCK1401317.1 hypothetical protein [Bradyrhizobium sp. 39]MCK1752295.1 hypothetical protein [Bradyrhizobium sp. 135]UPJ39139.1 hypothetical protein IVB45_37075 [Bradyrhizobium sp. 4]
MGDDQGRDDGGVGLAVRQAAQGDDPDLAAREQYGRLQLGQADRDRVLAINAATVDRLLIEVKIAASGGRRRRARR